MNKIESIPFFELVEDINKVKDKPKELKKYFEVGNQSNFFNRHALKTKASWFLPQLTAYLASFKLTRDETGKVRGDKFWHDNVDPKSGWSQGIYQFIKSPNRGNYIISQNKDPGLRYSALVPLVLAAHKEYNDVPYSAWDINTLAYVVDSELLGAMTARPMHYSVEELLSMRDIATTVIKTGKKKSVTGTHIINGLKTINPQFNSLPNLTRVMLLQTWVAHPTIRNRFMVLDPYNWDSLPEPLADEEIF